MRLVAPSGRSLAVWFAVLMLASLLPLPGAAAAGGVALTLTEKHFFVDGVEVTNTSALAVFVGTPIEIKLTATVNAPAGTCSSATSAPTARMDLTNFGRQPTTPNGGVPNSVLLKDPTPSAPMADTSVGNAGNSITTYNWDENFNAATSRGINPTDGALVVPQLTLQLASTQGACAGAETVRYAFPSMNVDTVEPHPTVTIEFGRVTPGQVAVGDKIYVNATDAATTDMQNGTVDLHAAGIANPIYFSATNSTTIFPYVDAVADSTITDASAGGTLSFFVNVSDPPHTYAPSRVNFVSTTVPQPTGFDARLPHGATVSNPAPQAADGTVQLTVRATGDSDVSSANTSANGYFVNLTRQPSGTSQTFHVVDSVPVLSGAGTSSFVIKLLPNTHFAPGASYSATVFPKDAHGNFGPTSAAVSFDTPTGTLYSIVPDALPALVGKQWPIVTGTWSAPLKQASSTNALQVFINDSTGKYWNGATNTFVAARTLTPIPNNLSAAATPAFSGPYSWNVNSIQNASLISSGTYSIGVQWTGNDSTAARLVYKIDQAAPTAFVDAASNKIVGVTDIQQVEPLAFRADFMDDLAGFNSATKFDVLVTSTAPGNPPVLVGGVPVLVNCDPRAVTPSCSFLPGTNVSTDGLAIHANLSITLPALPFGSYMLNVTTYDTVGNPSAPQTFGGPNIVPRVNLLDQPGSPLLLAGNQINFFVYAGYNLTENDPAGCTTPVCPVTIVEIYGRNVTTSPATALGTKDTPRLATFVPTHDGPGPITLSVTPDSQPYYNYTSGPLSTGVLNPNAMLLTARAVLQNSGGVTVSSTNTTWKLVRLPSSAGALSFAKPANDAAVFMDTASGTAAFNVTYDKSGLDAPPVLNYFVAKNGTNTRFAFNSTMDASNFASIAPVSNSGSVYFYNFSNNLALPPGEYVLNASIVANISNQRVDPSTSTRYFAVQNASPSIAFNAPLTGVFPPTDTAGGSVGRGFDLGLDITHGYSNISLSRLNLTLRPTGTAFNLTNASLAGFRYWFNGTVFNASNLTSTVVAHVKMPDNATDGTIWTLNVSVTTDSADFGGNDLTAGAWWRANASALRTVKVDLTPPGAGVYYQSTNDSGNSTTPVLNGFADDHGGSGVKTVKVRITDLNATPPLMFDANAFAGVGGFVVVQNATSDGQWLSSASAPTNITNVTGNYAVADVKVTSVQQSSTSVPWLVDGTPRHLLNATTRVDTGQTPLPGISFNRDHWYQVDVAAADNVNDFTSPITFTTWIVNFDPSPPVISATAPISGPARVNWHETAATLTVNASDNHCVNRVTLTGKTPSGVDVPRADFAPSNAANAACTSPLSNRDQTWTLSLAQFPNVTDEIGVYNFTVEVMDQAGQITRDTTHVLRVTVVDTQPAVVKFLSLSPPIVPTGGRSILTADIFENHRVLYVNATLQRLQNGGTVDQSTTVIAPMRPIAGQVAANGSGKYEIWSDTDLHLENLTVGDYLWTVRAIDDNMAVTCPGAPPETFCAKTSIIVRVADSSAPFVQQDSPASGATIIGGSPSFHWRVLGANITAAGISLRTGPVNGTLQAASPAPTISALAPVGNVATGFDVTFAPGSLAGVANYSVNLTALNVNGLAGSSAANFIVDALPPRVTNSVSNAAVINAVTYATATTRVTLNASDNETSIASLTYKLNGGQPIPYTVPFAVTGPDGAWQADYVATDLAGNTASGSVALHVDATPPVISLARGGDNILLTVSDAGVGVDEGNVTVHYAYGTSPTFAIVKATKVAGNSYQAQLPGNATATGLRYFFDAKDLLGNLGAKNSSASPLVIEKDQLPQNIAPKLTITAPTNGSEVRDAVDLKWIAEDPEGQPIAIQIALREPAGTGSFLVKNGENTGTYHVDLANKSAGSYTLVVTATDGVQSAQESVTFTVPTQRPAYECLSCPGAPVQPNKPISFGIGLNPVGTTVTSATYNITRDGTVVSTGIMKQQQGAWVLSYTPTVAGKYKIFVTETDANGVAKPSHEVNAFEVQGAAPVPPTTITTTTTLPPSFLALIAIGILTIALAAYGAFVRWKP